MTASVPDALLFITPDCPHCPTVLQGLSELLKQTLIGKLTVVNVVAHPELASEYGVRSAPWLRLGSFTLTGSLTPTELKQWASWSTGNEGVIQYVEHLLSEGGFKQAGIYITEDTQRLAPLLAIVASPEKSLVIRSGVSALLEAYRNTTSLQNLIPQIGVLTSHTDHRVRADACHLLGLSGSPTAKDYLQKCLTDQNEEVREIANESLALITNSKH
jgi:thiol-disulfide isomerase/thioredoxin